MTGILKKHPAAVLLSVSALMLFTHLGAIATNIMEARNLITAREMVNNGHWIFTTINGMPRYEKPPLPTWITAVFMLVFGMQNIFWLRLPVALVSLLLVYFFYKLIKRLQLNNLQPLNASLILITSFYIFFAGRDNQWDMYTHAFMIASIYFLYKSFNQTKQTAGGIILSALFFGCSFLSKGPVSLYALFLPFVIAYFIVYKNNVSCKLMLVLFVVTAGLIIGFSWPLYVKYFDANAAAALSKQTENWGNYEVKPFWHYWSFFTQSGMWALPSLIALAYFYMRSKVKDVKAYTFSFLWTIISLILLSLIPEKKMRYTLPVLIPLALNTSFYIEYLIQSFRVLKSKIEKALVYFNFGLIALIALVTPFLVYHLFKSQLSDYIIWYAVFVIMLLCCGVVIILSLIKKNFAQTFYASIIFMCSIVVTVIPLSKMYYSNTQYYSAKNIHSIENKLHIRSYETKDFVPEIIWDYGKPMPQIQENNITKMPQDSMFGLLMYPEEKHQLTQAYKNYYFTKYATVDVNQISSNKSGYNRRLVKDYYLVKKLK